MPEAQGKYNIGNLVLQASAELFVFICLDWCKKVFGKAEDIF